MRRGCCATAVLIALAGSARAEGVPPIGTTVADCELRDGRGTVRRLGEWADGRLLVVAFVGAECPVAELYAGRLAGLHAEFGPRGVAFLGIAPNRRDTPAALERFARAHGLRFPIVPDAAGAVVARLGARRTPEVVVLDDRRRIRYRGRIDDQYAVGSRRARAGRLDLAVALGELLAGRDVSRPEVEAVGCPIERPWPAAIEEVTYCRDVAPLLQRHCVRCHRPGQAAPFALTTYRKAAGWAEALAEAVEDGRMPPWHADPRFGHFANEARLTDREKGLLRRWVDAGAPEGDPADLPPPATFPEAWSIAPDRVIAMPAPFTVPAGGVVDYQYIEVDPGFREDTWVRAIEVRPGNRKVVHHCNVYLRAPGRTGDQVDLQGELESFCLAAYTPGTAPTVLPAGMAKRIPAGWKLVFVVHYAPVGTVQQDRTSVGLSFADPKSVRREVATQVLLDPDLCIPPHAADHRVEHSRRFDADVLLLAMFPHMHLRGKSFRYEATYPDGRTEVLLDVPRYDFNWQHRYVLVEPKRLPAGTTLRGIAHYDNSRDNPANPDPDATVRAGQQSWDEMFNGYYDIALADQDLTRPPSPAARLRALGRRAARPAIIVAGWVAAGLLVACLVRRKTA